MKRMLGFVLALLLLFLGARWAPAPRGGGQWRPLVRALGPLRSVWADVLLIQFDEQVLNQDVFAVSEQVERILRLRPDLPGLRVHFGHYLALDLSAEQADLDLRRERVRQGLKVLREGVPLLPSSPEVPAALADALRQLAEIHPERLEGVVTDPYGEAFEAYRQADQRAPQDLGTAWAVRLRLFLEKLLQTPALLPARAAEVRRLAEEIAGRPGLPEEARAGLEQALARAP